MSGSLMRECKLCRKLFSSSGGRICQDCYKYLDEIYPAVRTYIRDNNNPRLDVAEIADALEFPIKYVQGLVDCGYLNRDLPNAKPSENEDSEKDKLSRELQKAANELKANASRKQSSVTYGQERYTQGKR
jgi:hypothetical protein